MSHLQVCIFIKANLQNYYLCIDMELAVCFKNIIKHSEGSLLIFPCIMKWWSWFFWCRGSQCYLIFLNLLYHGHTTKQYCLLLCIRPSSNMSTPMKQITWCFPANVNWIADYIWHLHATDGRTVPSCYVTMSAIILCHYDGTDKW